MTIEEVIAKWEREIAAYDEGAKRFESPVSDMNRASASTAREMLKDIRNAVGK